MAGTRDFGNVRFWKDVQNQRFTKKTTKNVFEKKKKTVFPGSNFPLIAIHKIISHIWEDGSRKVNNDEPDLSFFHETLLTCYQPGRSKTLFFDLNPKGGQICVSWAHPLGSGLGPPTWARLGPSHVGPAARLRPTHLGPAWAHPFGFGLGGADAGAGAAGRPDPGPSQRTQG